MCMCVSVFVMFMCFSVFVTLLADIQSRSQGKKPANCYMNDMLSCSFCASVIDFCYSVCRWDGRIGVMSSSLFKSVLIGAQRVVAALLRPVAFHLVTVANSL